MSNRTFEAVFQYFKDELRDYDYMDIRNEYEHITEHGEGPFQEYARYKFDKSDRRVPAEELGVSQMCDQLRDAISAQHDNVEFVKTIYGQRVTIEVYTDYSEDND